MLKYVYNFFKYFIWTLENERSTEDKLNISSFGLYTPYIYENANTIYPSVMVEILFNDGIEEFSNKVQRYTLTVNVYTIDQLPNNLSSLEIMTDNFLETLGISDKIFSILEAKNSKLLPTFDENNDVFFIHSVHRTQPSTLNVDGQNKITKSTYAAMLSDFSATPIYNKIDTGLELDTDITINNN